MLNEIKDLKEVEELKEDKEGVSKTCNPSSCIRRRY